MSGCENTKLLKIWIKEKNQKICRPCTLPILVQWYTSELKEVGKEDVGKNLVVLTEKENVTPDEVAEELDNIKEKVDGPLKARLKEFDCTIQINEENYQG